MTTDQRRRDLNKETRDFVISLLEKHCGSIPSSPESFWQGETYLRPSGDILDEILEALDIYEES